MTAAASKTRPARRTPTPAQREKWDAERDAKIADLAAQLKAAVAALDNEANWHEVLNTLATFGAKYSANNQMLIYSTCLSRGFEPKMVQAFGAWKAAGHPVRKGEHAISIFGPVMRRLSKDEADAREAQTGKRIARTPDGRSVDQFLVGFKPVSVFDVSQVTDPDTVTLPPTLVERRMVRTSAVHPQLLTGSDPTGALPEVEALVAEDGYVLRYVDPAALFGANGNTDGHTINIRNDVDDAQKIKTLVHEWAHNRLGHTAPAYPYAANRGQAETEAEATAYVVCGALGLDTQPYSAPYVCTWSEGNTERITTALSNITTAARAMLTALTPVTQPDEPASAPVG